MLTFFIDEKLNKIFLQEGEGKDDDMVKKDEKESEDLDSNKGKEVDSSQEEDKNKNKDSGIKKDEARESEDDNAEADRTENNGRLIAQLLFIFIRTTCPSITKSSCYFLHLIPYHIISIYVLKNNPSYHSLLAINCHYFLFLKTNLKKGLIKKKRTKEIKMKI